MLPSRIKFRHLRCFLEAARRLSVTEAAAALNTTQPAVSRSLRELETEVGAQLFERTRHGVKLTDAGHVMLRYVAPAMTQIAHGVSLVRGDSEVETIALGALPNASARFLPGIIQQFKDTYPEINVRLFLGTNLELLARLRSGEVSFVVGFLADAETMSGLSFENLYSEELVFCVRPGHPLGGSESVTVAQMDQHPIVQPLPQTAIRVELDRFLIASGMNSFANTIETISIDFARSYAHTSDAVIIFSLGGLERDIQEGRLIPLPVLRNEAKEPVGLTFEPTRRLSAATQQLVALIRASLDAKA